MTVTAVIGMQWGDEAKGKIVDFLANDYDYIVRFNGGDNAGHAIKVDGRRFGMRIIPSAIFYPNKFKVIANGVVINPDTLLSEVEDIRKAGYLLKNLVISSCAHIILPWHKVLDIVQSQSTMKRGIGPAYSDKNARYTAIRVADLLYEKNLKKRLVQIAKIKEAEIKNFGREIKFNTNEIFTILKKFANRFKHNIKNTVFLLNNAISKRKCILLEGAQGTLLDVDHGTYPYVTSSSTIAGGASTGTGIAPKRITRIIGVAKAYITRVGTGPFPTEQKNNIGERLRQKGLEFGIATGKLRRCGWLDLVALKYAVMLNGVDELALTKVDVLSGLKQIKICIAYNINGRETDMFPINIEKLNRAKPIYKTLKGWTISKEEWKNIKKTKIMPMKLKVCIDLISKSLKTKISIISYGAEREETLLMK